MSRVLALAPLAFLTTLAPGPAAAQSLQVAPLMIDLPPASTSVGSHSSNQQQRRSLPFRRASSAGRRPMAATSLRRPKTWSSARPMVTVRGGTPSTVRLVRVSKAPVSGEETYRLLIDEIPDRKNLQAGTVALHVRQSLPVFFAGNDVAGGLAGLEGGGAQG